MSFNKFLRQISFISKTFIFRPPLNLAALKSILICFRFAKMHDDVKVKNNSIYKHYDTEKKVMATLFVSTYL